MKGNRIWRTVLAVFSALFIVVTSCPAEIAVAGDTWEDYEDQTPLSESDNESGLIDSSGNKIYQRPIGNTGRYGWYKTDLTNPDVSTDVNLDSLTFWQKIEFIGNLGLVNIGNEEKIKQAYYATIDGQGAVGDLVGGLVYTLASFLDGIFEVAGITVDSVIMGRVGGNGVLVDKGDKAGSADDTVISLFHFELEKGNPYGVVAALIYSAIRKYMYIVMVLVAFVMVVKTAVKSDTPRAKLEFKDKMMSLVTALALVVFMPYFLEVFLYLRDILLSGIVGEGILSLFSNGEYGLIESFRGVCDEHQKMTGSVLWTFALFYLAAVCISLVFAAMYIANALSTLLHVVAFPVVCVKSLADKRALGTWVWEIVGLATMPLIDGILLLVPLIFNKLANGATALNFVSLLACGCMLTARQQFRKSIGLQSNNMMESGGLLTAIGMSRLIGSVGRAGSRAVGQVTGGIKQGASDDAMANLYDAQAQLDKAKTENAEKQIANGFFNSSGGIAVNPASLSGKGEEAGAVGSMSQRTMGVGGSQLSYKQSMFDEAEAEFWSDGSIEFNSGALNEEEVDASIVDAFVGRAQDLKKEQIRTVLGKDAPISSENNLYDKLANVDNFESQEFANKLSNAKKAEMYRQRAQNARRQGITSGVFTAGGAALGGIIGFGATAYMDSGTSAMITSAGIDVGAAGGNAYKSLSEMRRLSKDANAETTIDGELSDIKYTIRTGRNVPEGEKLKTENRYRKVYPKFEQEIVDRTGIADKQAQFQAPVETQGYYSYVDDLSVGTDETKHYDSSTGEWYSKANGDAMYAEDVVSGKEPSGKNVMYLEDSNISDGIDVRSSVQRKSWYSDITPDMINVSNKFKEFMKDEANEGFVGYYARTFAGVSEGMRNGTIFGSTELNSSCQKRFDDARSMAAKFDSLPYKDEATTASYNKAISMYKAMTKKDITNALTKNMSSAMDRMFQNEGMGDNLRIPFVASIKENVKWCSNKAVSVDYMDAKQWNFDSLKR